MSSILDFLVSALIEGLLTETRLGLATLVGCVLGTVAGGAMAEIGYDGAPARWAALGTLIAYVVLAMFRIVPGPQPRRRRRRFR